MVLRGLEQWCLEDWNNGVKRIRTMVLRGWELRYNYYILTRYAAPAMFPTTNAVFSQLTVLLFENCILVL